MAEEDDGSIRRAAFDKLRDQSLRWPHPKSLPERDEATGFVLFKSCLVSKGRHYPPAAMESAAGAPVTVDHDNLGDFTRAYGFVDGPARVENGDLVVDIVLTRKEALDLVEAGGHCISLSALWRGDTLLEINHVALLAPWDTGAVEGARLTGVEAWLAGEGRTWAAAGTGKAED